MRTGAFGCGVVTTELAAAVLLLCVYVWLLSVRLRRAQKDREDAKRLAVAQGRVVQQFEGGRRTPGVP